MTYVHKGDEQFTINMRVQNTEGNNLKKIHSDYMAGSHKWLTYQACDPQIVPLTKTLNPEDYIVNVD